jgi:ubiquinone/menaquinone biosynthesis C-methylase UbiE
VNIPRSYDSVAERYAEHLFHELDGKPLDRHLLNRFAEAITKGGAVADVGCGPGQVARYLHGRGVNVFGVDISPAMIRTASRLSPGIDFRVGDMHALEIPDASLAGIVAFYSIVHFTSDEVPVAMRECHRVLAPGAPILLAFHIGSETVHLDDMWGAPVSLDFRFHRVSDVTSALREAGFAVSEVVEREPYPDAEHPSRRCYLFARAAPAVN